ncbi:MAG: LysM peptidoglycan-binding domain-containing protein [Bacteroidia bacterium]
MNRLLNLFCAFSIFLFLNQQGCIAQNGKPKSPSLPVSRYVLGNEIKSFLGDSIAAVLQNPEGIDAYRFRKDSKKTTKDTTIAGFCGFSVEKKIIEILDHHSDSLMLRLSNDESYEKSAHLPSCGFHPDLGFHIKSGGKSVRILMTTDACAVIRFYYNNELKEYKVKDALPGIGHFYQLGKELFPRYYPALTAPITRPSAPDVVTSPNDIAPVTPNIVQPTPPLIPPTPSITPSPQPSNGITYDSVTTSAADSLGAKAKGMQHTIAKGETLKSIATKYGITEAEITKLNPSVKKDSDLKEKQKLNMIQAKYHAVSGENEAIESIAAVRKVKVEQLKALNPTLKGKKLKKGDKVRYQ